MVDYNQENERKITQAFNYLLLHDSFVIIYINKKISLITRIFSFQKFFENSKTSGDLSLADFIYYVREHEKNLRLHFSHLDRNKDGKFANCVKIAST